MDEGSNEFSRHDHAGRISRLRDTLFAPEKVEAAEATPSAPDLDAVLITNLANIRYLTGFTGSSAFFFLTPDRAVFITDGRYGEQSEAELATAGVDAERMITGGDGSRPALASVATGAIRIGLEAGNVTWAQVTDLREWLPDSEFFPTHDLVEELRMSKEASEVERLAAAARIGDEAFDFLVETIEPGIREDRLAVALERFMVDAGASGVSFEPIVASGVRGALPHARPTEKVIERGEMVVLDFGCVVDGYCSDMTRTVAIGKVRPQLEEDYELVREAQMAGIRAARGGVETAAVDAACRDVIAASGKGDLFVHSTGHGVGLEIHEAPRLGQKSTGILGADFVVTVEPGVYQKGIGGVRIEDMVVVGDGDARILTSSPKELIVL